VPEEIVPTASSEAPMSSPTADDEATAVEPEPELEPELEPEPEPPARPETSPPVIEETESPEIAAGQVRVLLTYSGDCWTEITDAAGRRLFFDLGRDGRSVELSGAEPLSVLFGSPGNVGVQVNGDDFALPADARPDRPLRLTIAGS
jgi:cytoskeleton protein RodZ